jgi:methylmalonyl-CoA mutase N-terminal domain/subunit
MEARALVYLDRIDAMGGMVRAIEQGFVQKEIQNAAYQYQKEVEAGERVVVGVNRYVQTAPTPIPVFRVDPELERGQVERVRALRARRDQGRAARALEQVECAARSTDNLLPVILEAVESYATVGEISDRLRGAFGEYRETVFL